MCLCSKHRDGLRETGFSGSNIKPRYNIHKYVFYTHTHTPVFYTHTRLSSLRDPEGIKRFFVLLRLHLILPVSPQHVFLFLAVTPHPPQTISFLAVHHSSLPFCLLLIPHSSLSVPGSLRTRAPVCLRARTCACGKRACDLVRDSPPNSL